MAALLGGHFFTIAASAISSCIDQMHMKNTRNK